ncbi:MAG: UDP-N-acetylmuramoyl-L-alanine--D-glutamate ligase [Patescibacteria group bacterium]|nr:UDP-N-acetylmuramoyl-L-alanine--D-glutamate ligase [Patescibacteria group bacterium]
MKIAIIGFGTEGEAAYRYWKAQGADIAVHDVNPDTRLPADVDGVLGPDYLQKLDGYDLIVRSPGTRPDTIHGDAPVTSVTREFMKQCPAPIIGVTGTKGKGTTASLVSEILKQAGKQVWVGGNIGVPPLDFLAQVKPEDVVVLELSSFQLMDVETSPHIAVCLMIVPEHMNWHPNMAEYVAAKGNLFRFQQAGDMAVYHPGNEYSAKLAELSPGKRVPYLRAPGAEVRDGQIVIDDEVICGSDEVGLVGPHNLENICAAVTATWELAGCDPEPVRRAVKAFKGLEHRLEPAGEVDGVRYYDDSFSTTPETAVAAIASFAGPKVLILGGSDKQSEYGELARAVARGNVRRVILIGDMAPRLRHDLEAAGFTDITMGPRTMPEIAKIAREAAQKGDVVLLSPACASFGLFTNYKERGDQFKAAVAAWS